MLSKHLTLIVAAALGTPAAAASSVRGRGLTSEPAGVLKGLTFVSIEGGRITKEDVLGSDTYEYSIPSDLGRYDGYTIKAETDGRINYVKFIFDGEEHRQYSAPNWYMGGNNDDFTWINEVPYLKESCGPKEIIVEGHVWDGLVFKKEIHVDAECPDKEDKCAAVQCSTGFACDSSSGDCVCSSSYTCSENSFPTSSCPVGPQHCECNEGFALVNGKCDKVDKCAVVKCSVGFECDSSSGACVCSNSYSCPANSFPTSSCPVGPHDCLCTKGFALANGLCNEVPPQPKVCYLWTDSTIFYGWHPGVPVGTTIETRAFDGRLFSTKTTNLANSVTYPVNKWFYQHKNFEIRFVDSNGIAGDWQDCWNYYQGHPPRTGCHLNGNTLYFGKAVYYANIEVETLLTGMKFHYRWRSGISTYQQKSSFKSEPFKLRINGGAWEKCKNYTPIALDLDRSGDVEAIPGTFVIDITADGKKETLDEWFSPTDGILIDTKHGIEDGIITGHHLFGDQGRTYVDGFDKLALLDQDGDDLLSGDELDGLAIWIDANSNAILDDGEMTTLEDQGIASLSTRDIQYVSVAFLEDGEEIMTKDVFFAR